MASSVADVASIFPIAQQIVGLGTIISNSYKSGKDLKVIAFSGFNIAADLTQASYKTLQGRINSQTDVKCRLDQEIHNHIKSVKDSSTVAVNGVKSLARHVTYIGIGAIRSTFGWGTVFSIGRCLLV